MLSDDEDNDENVTSSNLTETAQGAEIAQGEETEFSDADFWVSSNSSESDNLLPANETETTENSEQTDTSHGQPYAILVHYLLQRM